MGCGLLIPYVKYDSREERLKILGYFTSLKTIGVTYWFSYLSLIMYRLLTHVKTLKRKENQCSHWFLEKTKILPVHTDVLQEPLVLNRCFYQEDASLPCAYLAALWTLAWVTLGWRADGILTWSPAQGWRRHRIEGSENPQNSECPLLHFQGVISFS